MKDKTNGEALRIQSLNWLITGAVSGAFVVGIGAFGAHGLKPLLMELNRETTFETAVDYHVLHTLAILLVGIVQYQFKVQLKTIGYLFLIGILIFSGSLYLLSVTDIRWLGAITPFGGVGFMAGWSLLAWKLYQQRK